MSRAFMLLLSIVFYAIFLVTFLYLIGFVGDLPGLPKTVDAGTGGPFAPAAAVDLALISLFGVQPGVGYRLSQ